MRIAALAILALALPLGGCVAARIIAAPVDIAGDVVAGAGKGIFYVGGVAVRSTVDLVDGPDQRVKLTVKYRDGRRTRTTRKEIDSKDVERELKRIGKKGRIIDVEVEPVN